MTPLVRRAIARAFIALAFAPPLLLSAPASAQFGFQPPTGPATAPCNAFAGFPLSLNLGQRADGLDGISSRCGFQRVQDGLNTLAGQRGQPGGFATLDPNGLIPLSQIPAVGYLPSSLPILTITGKGSTGDISGMSVGGGTLGGGLIPSVLALLTPAQIADARSGNPTIDLAPVLNAALNNCAPGAAPPAVDIPRGVIIGVASPVNASTCKARLNVDGGIKQIAPFPLVDAVDTISGVVTFSGTAHGSALTGSGTIDGNRASAAILTAYLGGPRSVQANGLYVMKNLWECVAIGGVDNPRVEGVTLQNCMTTGIQRSSNGSGARIRNVQIKDSSVALTANGNTGDFWSGITATNIGNVVNGQAIPAFSYAMNYFSQTNLTVDGLTLDGYQVLAYDGTPTVPGTRIGDPMGAVVQFQRLINGTIRGVTGRNINFDTASDQRRSPAIYGTFCDSCENVTMSDLSFTGTYFGITLFGPRGLSLSNFVIDGQYNAASASALGVGQPTGLALLPTAQLIGQTGLSSAFDHNNMDPGRHISISNGTVRRAGLGVALYAGNASISNIETTANLQSGVQIWATSRNGSYPNSPAFMPRDLSLSNIRSTYNGACGFQIHDGVDINYSSLVANDNFQDNTTACAAGISLTAGFGTKKQRNSFNGWVANDNQSEPITSTASFLPGARQNGTYQFIASNSSQLHVGQRVIVKNGGGAGTDLTVKITDITNDNVSVQTLTANAAWSPAACTTALPGTVSQSGGQYLLNGTGTNFTTALTGPAYIVANGQYLRVGAARSDTLLQMDSTPSPGIANASATLIACQIQGIPSQQVGFALPADPTISDTSLGDPSAWMAIGNVAAPVSVASASLKSDWLDYPATLTSGGGSGVSLSSGATYKLDGKTLFVRGYVQVASYTTAPTSVSFTLPNGLVPVGGATVPGFNANSGVALSGQSNGLNTVTLFPIGGALVSGQNQYLQFNGSMQVQ